MSAPMLGSSVSCDDNSIPVPGGTCLLDKGKGNITCGDTRVRQRQSPTKCSLRRTCLSTEVPMGETKVAKSWCTWGK